MCRSGRFPKGTFISPNRRVWFEGETVAWQDTVDAFDPKRGRGKGRRPRASALTTTASLVSGFPALRPLPQGGEVHCSINDMPP